MKARLQRRKEDLVAVGMISDKMLNGPWRTVLGLSVQTLIAGRIRLDPKPMCRKLSMLELQPILPLPRDVAPVSIRLSRIRKERARQMGFGYVRPVPIWSTVILLRILR